MIQIVSTAALLLGGILCISLINLYINKRTKGRFNESEIPLSINLLKSILFICGGLLISETGGSSQEVIQILTIGSGNSGLWLPFITYFTLFFSISLTVLIISLWFSTMVFAVLTKGRSVFENAMQDDFRNVILFGGISVSIVLVVKSGLSELLSQIIQFPNSPIFH